MLGCGEVKYSDPVSPDAASTPAPSVDAAPGACSETPLVDQAASSCGFSDGSFDGTLRSESGAVRLAMDSASGSFVSRVFDSGDDDAVWSSLLGETVAPHQKPLPDDGAREEGYARDNIDMADNVLLLHFDEREVSPGMRFSDSSGRGNDAIVASTAAAALEDVPGQFRRAIHDTLDSHFYINIDPEQGSDLDFGEDDFTWALWVQTTQDCTGNKVYMGFEAPGADGLIHLWLGCASGSEGECEAGSPEGRAGGTFTSAKGNGNPSQMCGLRQINDGKWHHLALVKSGHLDTTLSLYVDGELEDTLTTSFDQPLVFTQYTQFTIGAFPVFLDKYQADAMLDEMAIWRRGLSADEVLSLYRRGALRLGLQVRACADKGCEGAGPFVGPGGDEARRFQASGDALTPVTSVTLEGQRGRYLQYRAVLESDIDNDTPVLRQVEVQP